jgi:Nucleoside 2-deoxyribosyltransferase like
MKVIKPNSVIDLDYDSYSIFLGGSIEMNTAEDWQTRLIAALGGYPDSIVLLNPRRDDWDSSWSQDPTPGTPFQKQVTWELEAQEQADTLVYYFDPATKSPITLMELGAFGFTSSQSLIVCCSPDFWRYGNVAVFCARYRIQLVNTFDELVLALTDRILQQAL